MSEERKTIDFKILNTLISVVAEEDDQHIREIASFVDQTLEELRQNNPRTNYVQIAVIGCMNIAEMLFEERKNISDIKRAFVEADKRNNQLSEIIQYKKIEINQLEKVIQENEQTIEALKEMIADKETLLNQNSEQLRQAKQESASMRQSILDLQNQLFESKIELSKLREE